MKHHRENAAGRGKKRGKKKKEEEETHEREKMGDEKKWRTVDVCVFAHSGVWTILLYFSYKTVCLSYWEVYNDCVDQFVEALICVLCIRILFKDSLCCFVKCVESQTFELNNGVLHVLFSAFSLSVLTVRHNHRVHVIL